MTRADTAPALRVLYVVSLFPCWSETFIAREISTLVGAGILTAMTRNSGLGLMVLGIGVGITVATGTALAFFAPARMAVKEVDLTDSQIGQYASHPRLDLFVDANSPHSM